VIAAAPTTRSFTAMGTTIEVFAHGGLDEAESEFHRLDRLLTRFDPASELSRLNRTGAISAGPELLELTRLALAARERTRARFDPTVHDAVVAAGYDRTFAELALDGTDDGLPVACGGAVEVAGETIRLGPGARLDLGGIAKGWAADRVCDMLAPAGPCLVNAGGDVAARGTMWPVGVETPDGTVTVGLEDAAMATTGRDRRRWRRNGEVRHHLIDPATGAPSESDLLRVTVVAHTAVDAEVMATSLFLTGEQRAVAEAEALGVPAILVTAHGRVLMTGDLA
jgi:thiamine biosynthesis lipoprotein